MSKSAPAKGRYEDLKAFRSGYLTAAYEAAKLTIPSLFPESTDAAKQDRYRKSLTTPWQGLGARGVNNVASKLLLTLFPPSTPILKYQIDPSITKSVQDEDEAARLISEIEKKLAKREIELSEMIESDGIRPQIHEVVRQLIIAGNCLLQMPEDGGMRVFRLDRYVVKRDAMGRVIDIIVKETMTRDALPEGVREFLAEKNPLGMEKPKEDEDIDLFTHINMMEGGQKYEVYQEIEGEEIPDTRGNYPADAPEFIPLRLYHVDGEDYGRGLVEENIGDLQSYDALQRAMITAAANAADVKWMVNPDGDTNIRQLKKAESGEYIAGRPEDVRAVTLDKFADMRTAKEVMDGIGHSLSFVFMLNSSVRRSGERVTAEEIREVARELEDTFGGIYTVLSQDLQLMVVKRYERRAEKQGKLSALPEGIVKPIIVTGLESIGRSHDLEKLRQLRDEFLAFSQIDPETGKYIHTDEFLKRVATSLGTKQDGLLRDREDVEQEMAAQQEQAGMMALAQQATGPAINQYGSMMQAQMGQGEPEEG